MEAQDISYFKTPYVDINRKEYTGYEAKQRNFKTPYVDINLLINTNI